MNSLKAKNVSFDKNYLSVELEDGRIIRTPLEWYLELKRQQLHKSKIGNLFVVEPGSNGKN